MLLKEKSRLRHVGDVQVLPGAVASLPSFPQQPVSCRQCRELQSWHLIGIELTEVALFFPIPTLWRYYSLQERRCAVLVATWHSSDLMSGSGLTERVFVQMSETGHFHYMRSEDSTAATFFIFTLYTRS